MVAKSSASRAAAARAARAAEEATAAAVGMDQAIAVAKRAAAVRARATAVRAAARAAATVQAEVSEDTAAKEEVMARVARGRVEAEVAEGVPGKLKLGHRRR